MNDSTKKWIFLKYSSAVLIPLMIWFIINFVAIYDSEHIQIVKFFSSEISRILFSIFIIIAYFFSTLTISEIFEDYISDEKLKNIANKGIILFATLIPLITIISLYNLY
jgi:succinate dehydrogenase / fumarate reductase, membrane anchor subunit|tara:strand:+ start:2853 stop:3179 length:327 start_codon:yes stop_codon:yes gene_type:complete